MRFVLRTAVVAAAFSLFAPVTGFAQDSPKWDASVGYSLLNDSTLGDEIDEGTFHGWLASFNYNVTPLFGITGELGRNSKTLDEFGGLVDADISFTSYLVGPRVGRRADKLGYFGQVLVGGVRSAASVDLLGVSVLDDEASNNFAIQPGAGVDFFFTSNIGIRVGADYRRIFYEDEGSNQFRFHVGVVFSR
jgi:opacity protein-like surface antigen